MTNVVDTVKKAVTSTPAKMAAQAVITAAVVVATGIVIKQIEARD